uniref:Glycosyltransferase n=1 Tax=Kalanchoe fedtschenkoi TaxID=63787 RepID=A0A7N0RCN2_KALFE
MVNDPRPLHSQRQSDNSAPFQLPINSPQVRPINPILSLSILSRWSPMSPDPKPHAVLLAYPLQGHVTPQAHLAVNLAKRGFTITFINTHFIHHKTINSRRRRTHTQDADDDIFASVRQSDSLDIRYLVVSDGLPLNFDRSLNHDQYMAALLHVFSAHVEDALIDIVSDDTRPPVTMLIADTFFVFPATLAKRFGILYVSFWTEPALVFTLYYHLELLRQNCHFACNDVREDRIDYIPGVKSIEPKDMPSYLQESDSASVVHQIIFKSFQEAKEADFVLCNTVQEMEPETISGIQPKKPFYSIGPVFLAGSTKVATSLWSESDCSRWLDSKPPGSVLYVSFGSYAHLAKQDLVEVAHGLLLSDVNFLWVLRPDIVSSEDTHPLPDGFESEAVDRGLVVQWCCQRKVLRHAAIGGFLTHCGWNSITESVWNRVPLLCFPLLTDQFTNRKLVVDDWKIGMNLLDRKYVVREHVCEKIKCLMGKASGELYRNNAAELSKLMEGVWSSGGSSDKNMNRFVKDVKARTQK